MPVVVSAPSHGSQVRYIPPRSSSVIALALLPPGPDHGVCATLESTSKAWPPQMKVVKYKSKPGNFRLARSVPYPSFSLSPSVRPFPLLLHFLVREMLAMITNPHSSTPRASNNSSQPWSKVCAWLSRERGRAGRLLLVALGAARAASASPNEVAPRPPRKTAVDEIVWHNRPDAEPRPPRDDTRAVTLDWVNIRRAGKDQRVERDLPPVPPQTEKEGKIYAVKVRRLQTTRTQS